MLHPLLILLTVFALLSPAGVRAQDDRCPPTQIEEIQGWLDEAEAVIALVDYASALSFLARVEARLSCAQGHVDRETLTRLYVDRGVTHFYLNSEDVAVQAFGKALAISPGLPWDETLGMRPRALFDRAQAQAAQDTPQPVSLPPIRKGVEIFVDGRLADSSANLQLMPGVHMIQVHSPEGEWWGIFFTVHSGILTVVPVPESALGKPAPVETPPTTDFPPQTTEPLLDPPSSMTSRYTNGIYAGAGLATGGFIAFTVAGTRYWSTRRELEANYDQTPADAIEESARDNLLRSHQRAARVANVGVAAMVVGAGLAVTSVVLERREDTQGFSLSPYWMPGEGGVSVSLRF